MSAGCTIHDRHVPATQSQRDREMFKGPSVDASSLRPNEYSQAGRLAMEVRQRRRMAAIGDYSVRPQLAGQRPSSLNASGLIGDGRSTTLSSPSTFVKADARRRAPTTARYAVLNVYFVGDTSTGYPASCHPGKPAAK